MNQWRTQQPQNAEGRITTKNEQQQLAAGETRSQNKVNTRDLRNAAGGENQQNPLGQAIKAGPLERDSRTSTKNLI
jgi:hypothetical protein